MPSTACCQRFGKCGSALTPEPDASTLHGAHEAKRGRCWMACRGGLNVYAHSDKRTLVPDHGYDFLTRGGARLAIFVGITTLSGGSSPCDPKKCPTRVGKILGARINPNRLICGGAGRIDVNGAGGDHLGGHALNPNRESEFGTPETATVLRDIRRLGDSLARGLHRLDDPMVTSMNLARLCQRTKGRHRREENRGTRLRPAPEIWPRLRANEWNVAPLEVLTFR